MKYFTYFLELNSKKICAGSGLNKKQAKFNCAKNALAIMSPKVYITKYFKDFMSEEQI